MRRLALILGLIVAASATALAASATGDDSRTYYIELDNAFGLVDGSEVKVAGVSAGTVTKLDINSSKRAVLQVELSGPVAVLGEDTICSTQPQSLIAEYFVDCTPKGSPIEERDMSEAEHLENPDIPVEQTRQTVQQDLVLSTMREPFRERLTLLINEFGTGLAGNAENLNEAIRRGAPALEETEKVFNLLASQNTIIRDLNVDSDRIISRLNERREDVVDFIEEAENTAAISASRREDLSQNFALLDDFLAELRPTMVELNTLATTGTPLAADLRRAAPGLTTLSRNLPDFNVSATDALVSLGKTSVVGQRALLRGRDEIRQLSKASKSSFSVADNLAKFLRDIDDPNRAGQTDTRANEDTGRKGETGYTGMEGLLNYLYYQTLAINQYDEIGHLLHFSIFEVESGPCATFNAGTYDPDGPGPEDAQPGVPNEDGSAATTNILEANRCVAWLGDSQPDINEPLNLPPYDPSVCPEGSNAPDLCDPAGAPTVSGRVSPARGSSSGTSAPAGGDETASPESGGDPSAPATGSDGSEGSGGSGGSGGEGGTTAPDVPGAPGEVTVPDPGGIADDIIDGVIPPNTTEGLPRGADSANSDLLGYLFGA